MAHFIKLTIFGKKGTLTVQFLLGFALIFGFMALFLMMTLTLTVSSVTQYITYSASRQLFLSHKTEPDQTRKAKEKYLKLTTSPDGFNFKFNPSTSLIEITHPDSIDNNIGYNSEFERGDGLPELFYGVWTDFNPKLLSMNNYLWGESAKGENRDEFFKTKIGSYLGREPSRAECENFGRKRWDTIKTRLGGQINNHGMRPYVTDPESLLSDNGC